MLERIDDALWVAAAPQTFLGLHLGTRMTIVQGRDGGAIVHSPIAERDYGWVLVFRDPDNIQLELYAPPGPS